MSKPSDVINALMTQLQNDNTLKGMSTSFLKGVRERIINFPCVIVEMLSISENVQDGFNEVDQDIQLAVIGYKTISNPDDQIEEMMDFSNAIKKAIETDHTLGGIAIQTTMPEEHHEFVNYPVRSIAIAVNVWNRMARTVRT